MFQHHGKPVTIGLPAASALLAANLKRLALPLHFEAVHFAHVPVLRVSMREHTTSGLLRLR